MADIIDLLQIKIEKAKSELPEETLNAISAVDWKAAILSMRNSKGYNFEQLGDLELETELLLCGLLSPADYPKELEKRMRISKMAANDLVNEMNMLVFKKIKEEMIKNSERKKIFANKNSTQKNLTVEKTELPTPVLVPSWEIGINKKDTAVLQSAGIEVVKPASEEAVHPALEQKILGPVQMPTVKTEYSIENISKTPDAGGSTVVEKKEPEAQKTYPKNTDPYRLSTDE